MQFSGKALAALWIILAFLLQFIYVNPLSAEDLYSGALIYYDFDNNTTNGGTGGATYDGSTVGDPTFVVDAYTGSHSLDFDGTVDGVDIGYGASFNPSTDNDLTISMWVKKGASCGGDQHFFGNSIGSNQRFYFRCRSGDTWNMRFATTNTTSTATVDVGNWEHILIETDATADTASFYIDGTFEMTVALPNFTTGAGDFYVGNFNDGGAGNEGWVGQVDDFALFERKLSATEKALISDQATFELSSNNEADGASVPQSFVFMEADVDVADAQSFTYNLRNSGGGLLQTITNSVRNGDYDLTNLTNVVSNTNLSLTSDSSGLTYVPTTDTLFTVHNSQNTITEIDTDGVVQRTITCTTCGDIEGITLVSSTSDGMGGYNHEFAIVTEGTSKLFKVTIGTATTAVDDTTDDYALGLGDQGNVGLEGVAYDSDRDVFYAVKEKTPLTIYEIDISGGSAVVNEICNAPTLFAGVPAVTDFSGLDYVESNKTLYIASHEGVSYSEVDLTNTAACVLGDTVASTVVAQLEAVAWDDTGHFLYGLGEPDQFEKFETNNYTVSHQFNSLASGDYKYEIEMLDASSNTIATEQRDITLTAGVDLTPPTITSITRQDPTDALTSSPVVTFRVTFSEDVQNVDLADFALATTGTTAGTLDNVSVVSASVYDVVVSSVSGDGTLDLNIDAGENIQDLAGNDYDDAIGSEEIYATETFPVWWDTDWTKRIRVTFDNTGRGVLTNFPARVALDSGKITYGDFKAGGDDIRFIDADGTTELDFEINNWDITGTSNIWVKVPQIDAGSEIDYIYMYYGNTGAANAEDIPGTWSEGYVMVQHMEEDPSGGAPQLQDSTSSDIDGTSAGTMLTGDSVSAQIGQGLDFDGGDDYINFGDNFSLADGTAEVWFNLGADITSGGDDDYILSKVKAGAHDGEWRLFVDDADDKLTFRIQCSSGGSPTLDSDSALSINTWYYTAAVWDDNTAGGQKLYLDGTQQATTDNPGCGLEVTGESFNFARNNALDQDYFSGLMDEVRISNVPRSADWIDASNDTMRNTLSSCGSVEMNDIVDPTINSISRQTPATSPTNATSVTYRVTFSEDVQNVDITDFELATTGTAAGTINSVSTVSADVYDVIVNSVSGDGDLDLDIAAGENIQDLVGNNYDDGITTEETYTIDNTDPTIDSIVRQVPTTSPVNLGTVTFRVTFSEAVQNVDVTDFDLTTTGTAAGAINSLSPVSAGVYDVVINAISGDGLLDLDPDASDDITDIAGNNYDDAVTSEEMYTIDNTVVAPGVTAPVNSESVGNPTNVTGSCEPLATVSVANALLAVNPTTGACSVGGAYDIDITWQAGALGTMQNIDVSQTDEAGNTSGNTTVTNLDITSDATPPNITTSNIRSDSFVGTIIARQGDTVTLTFTADEALNGATVLVSLEGNAAVAATDVSGNAVTDVSATYPGPNYPADTWQVTYDVTTDDDNGAFNFTINANDLAGNPAAAVVDTTSDGSAVTISKYSSGGGGGGGSSGSTGGSGSSDTSDDTEDEDTSSEDDGSEDTEDTSDEDTSDTDSSEDEDTSEDDDTSEDNDSSSDDSDEGGSEDDSDEWEYGVNEAPSDILMKNPLEPGTLFFYPTEREDIWKDLDIEPGVYQSQCITKQGSSYYRKCDLFGERENFKDFKDDTVCESIITSRDTEVEYEYEKYAPKKEVAAIALKMRRVPLIPTSDYQNIFTDIGLLGEAPWIQPTVETSLAYGLIPSVGDSFQPDILAKRSESFAMIMASVCMYPNTQENVGDDWKEELHDVASRNGLTNRSFDEFEFDRSLLRQELFVVASRAADWAERTGGCDPKPNFCFLEE